MPLIALWASGLSGCASAPGSTAPPLRIGFPAATAPTTPLVEGDSHPVEVEEPPAPPDLETRVDTFVALAASAGFEARIGEYGFLSAEDCCAPGGSCFGNNPAAPYGYAHLPPGPGQTAEDLGTEIDGAHSYFHLRNDEVVVQIGPTPPEVRYFGYRSHIAHRTFEGAVEPKMLLGTVGRDLNIHDIVQHRGTLDVFGRPIAVVTSADAAVARTIEALLVEAGFAETEIEHDRIGTPVVNLGLEPGADTFALIHRVAVFADPAAEVSYRANPGIVPVRLTPVSWSAPPEPHPADPLPESGSGTDEARWLSAVDELEGALQDAHPDFVASQLEVVTPGVNTYQCLERGKVCGDLSSRIWTRTRLFTLPSDGSFAVAFGVNHQRTGKVTYSSLAVQAYSHNIGLAAIESDAMPGTAQAFLPGHPLVDDLFAVVVARDCTPFSGLTCYDVPVGCPGVPETGQLYLSGRLYVDPLTGAAPAIDEIVEDRMMLFQPLQPVPR